MLAVVPFADESEAPAEANDVEYGPVSGVFTAGVERARRFARSPEAGNDDRRETGRDGIPPPTCVWRTIFRQI